MTDKPTKPARRRVRATKPKATAAERMPSHDEISERAYFIHIDEGGRDELTNWLRAETELAAA